MIWLFLLKTHQRHSQHGSPFKFPTPTRPWLWLLLKRASQELGTYTHAFNRMCRKHKKTPQKYIHHGQHRLIIPKPAHALAWEAPRTLFCYSRGMAQPNCAISDAQRRSRVLPATSRDSRFAASLNTRHLARPGDDKHQQVPPFQHTQKGAFATRRQCTARQ